MAGVQTTGFIDPHFAFQTHFVDTGFGVVEQVEATAANATPSWIIRLALVIADEDMLLKSRHGGQLEKVIWGINGVRIRDGYFFWVFASSSMTDSTSSCFRHSQTFKLDPM